MAMIRDHTVMQMYKDKMLVIPEAENISKVRIDSGMSMPEMKGIEQG